MRRPITLLLFALIAIGTLAGLYAGFKRYSVEQRNRRVELALEYTELKALAQVQGLPVESVLARFRDAGVTSLSITEETLAGLEALGELHTEQWTPTTVTVSSPETLKRIEKAFRSKGLKIEESPESLSDTVFEAATDEEGEEAADDKLPPGFAVRAEWQTLRPLGIGIDPDAVAAVRKAGLTPVGRISNFPGASASTMAAVLGDLKALGVQTVIFQGLEVIGYRGLQKETAEVFRTTGLNFGQIEFGKQKGDEPLGAALNGEMVRVHSISEAEMATLDETEAIDRFVRAARERNIRLCYLRLFTTVGADPVGENVEYIQKISRNIARGKEMEFGAAHIYEETGVGTVLFVLISMGVAAGLTFLIARLAPLSDRSILITLLLSAACVGAVLVLGDTGRRLVALLAALVFPTLACLRRDLLEPAETHPRHIVNEGGAMVAAMRGLAAASAITALGIAAIVGLLATRPYLVKVHQFLGIKAAHAVPVLIIGALAIVGAPRLNRPWREEAEALKARLRAFFSEPTRVGQLLLALVALVAFMMIVARTGNEPGVGVSGVELKFRSLLDRLLPVRPRTKEFLVGHPAFILALCLWYRGRRKWALPLFLVGVIGQVSILNTFCHTHTPLRLSLIRDLTGLFLGTIIGLAVFWLLERTLFRRSESPIVTASATPAAPAET